MTTKEQIRAEIERRKGYISVTHFAEDLLSFLDTLPDEPVTDCHDLTEAAKKYDEEHMIVNGCGVNHNIYDITVEDAFKACAEWMAKQGISYQATISADKTIPVLPMKDVSDMGLDYGDKVRIIILPKED